MRNEKKINIQVIAEIGVNHNGNLSIAKKLIDGAKKCGANFVKFQIYNPDEITTPYAKKTNYQKNNYKKFSNQYEMLKKFNLTLEQFKIIKNYCNRKKITFLASAFDIQSLDNLRKLKINYYKIPSGEITNIPYLEHLAKFKKNVFLSTGMSNLIEIKNAIRTLRRNGLNKKQITLLQCTSNYPTKISDLNLNVLTTFKKKFKLKLGFSDHTTNIETPLFAIFKGARLIEKHITLNKKMEGPDHKASLSIAEFKKMIDLIKNFNSSLGNFIKEPNQEENKTALLVRKSIVAKKNISKGEIFTDKNLACKRPGSGIPPSKLKLLLNKKSNKNYNINEMIRINL